DGNLLSLRSLQRNLARGGVDRLDRRLDFLVVAGEGRLRGLLGPSEGRRRHEDARRHGPTMNKHAGHRAPSTNIGQQVTSSAGRTSHATLTQPSVRRIVL